MLRRSPSFIFFFFNDTATTEIYTLSLHDALPISMYLRMPGNCLKYCLMISAASLRGMPRRCAKPDRKSTRLNSSHGYISYAVFCLKKKKHRHYWIRCADEVKGVLLEACQHAAPLV